MRFSLKSMMICVFAIAMLCAISFTLPTRLSGFILCSSLLLLPAALVTGIVFGTADHRTFAIGASATFATMIWAESPVRSLLRFNSFGGIESTITLLLALLLLACAGTTAIWTRRWLVEHAEEPAVDPPPLPEPTTTQAARTSARSDQRNAAE